MNNQNIFILIMLVIIVFLFPYIFKKDESNLVYYNKPTSSSNMSKEIRYTYPTNTLSSSNSMNLSNTLNSSNNVFINPIFSETIGQQNNLISKYLNGSIGSECEENNNINMNINPNSLITKYLNESTDIKCEENFDTMGPDVDIGNNMDFIQNKINNPSRLDKALSRSLVPDFQPNSLNITDKINSYGYNTTNPWDNNFYAQRGFINPMDGAKFANSIGINLTDTNNSKYCT